jgi:hypothetical protein
MAVRRLLGVGNVLGYYVLTIYVLATAEYLLTSTHYFTQMPDSI